MLVLALVLNKGLQFFPNQYFAVSPIKSDQFNPKKNCSKEHTHTHTHTHTHFFLGLNCNKVKNTTVIREVKNLLEKSNLKITILWNMCNLY